MGKPIDRPLRIAYAIQNVGGIDFNYDVGDTVPVKQTLLRLRGAGHEVSCLQLRGGSVVGYNDISKLDDIWYAPVGMAGSHLFRRFESGVRRLQRMLRLPYFAFFDAYRFYEACYRSLPGHDLCHEHNGLFCVGAALACRRLGMPYILTFSADPLFERALGGRPLRGFHRLIAAWEAKFTYQLARKIICVSEPAKWHLVESWQVDPEKIIVMPNGVDLDLFRPGYNLPLIRAELGLGEGPVIGFVGGFQHWHGLDRLIESLAHVLREVPNAQLLLIGDGRARPIVDQKIAEFGVETAVTITGLVAQVRVPEMLAVVDVAVLPYPQLPRELWFSPLKLYEYMAAGKAIVASRTGQIAEVIQHGQNGLLVEPGDVVDLARTLSGLLKNSAERARLGHNARAQAVQQHSWDRYVSCVEALYFDVLRHRLAEREHI
jgi:glycosyltransferase involved in cell wall biosynthesis